MAKGSQFEGASVKEDKSAGVSVDETDYECRKNSSLVERDVKELVHARAAGKSKEYVSPTRLP